MIQPCLPAVVIYTDMMTAYELLDDFIVCRKSDLKAGIDGKYASSTIVDSKGLEWRVNGAEKAETPAAFIGFNLFFNPSFRVRLNFCGEPKPVNLEWLKVEVICLLKTRNGLGFSA